MSTNETPTLGQLIRKRRRDNDLTQTQLAELVGVNDNTIINWEKDKRHVADNYLSLLVQHLGRDILLYIPNFENIL